MINKVQFPEITSAQVNVALLADKLNEVIDFINERTIEDDEDVVDISEEIDQVMGTLKPGVRMTRIGTYYIPGKGFIKKADAYE